MVRYIDKKIPSNKKADQKNINCRPTKRLIFNLNNNAKTSRVDVLPSGEIKWVSGGKDHRWISLSGISLVVTSSQAELGVKRITSIIKIIKVTIKLQLNGDEENL